MTSAIMNIVKKYQKEADDQDNWRLTQSEEAISGAKRCDLIAHHFMAIIGLLCINNQQVTRITQEKLYSIANQLLQDKSSRQRITPSLLKKIIGLFIKDTFKKDEEFSSILSEFELCYEEDNSEQNKGELSVLDDDDGSDFTNFLSSIKQPSQLNESTNSNSLSIGESWQKKEKDTWGESIHSMQVIKYLSQLSAPQTQLGYLCQDRSWKWNFTQNSSANSSQFVVSVLVHIDYKLIKKQLVESHQAKNKKTGRIFASFKMLRRIYISFPQIWSYFQNKMKEKSFSISYDIGQPIRLMAEKIDDSPVEIISQVKEQDAKFQETKKNYLKNIKNFKTEMSYLTQHNPGVINFQKIDKIQNGAGGQWNVKAGLTVKSSGKQKVYKEIIMHLNSKTAEELCIRKIIELMYEEFPDIMERMIMIKQKKGITA